MNSGVIDAFDIQMQGEHNGWLGSVMNYTSERSGIISNTNIPLYKKETLLMNLEDVRGKTFKKIQQFLFDTIWSESLSVIVNNSPVENRSVAVIAQSVFSSFPFSLASNMNSDKFILDDVDISYLPSIYSVYAISERLNDLKFNGTVAFLKQAQEANNPRSLKNIETENIRVRA